MYWLLKILFVFFVMLEIILAIYLLIPFFLLVTYYLKGGKDKDPLKNYLPVNKKEYDFAAIVTAHQDTSLIAPLVDSFCKQSYKNFIVYIVADDCNVDRLQFDDVRIKIIKPPTALHAKIKSIKLAVDHFIRPHDALIVFDADNLVHPEYLKNLNEYFRRGFKVVQTHMLSKNADTIYAKLDSIGHIYNTFVEREAKMKLGQSSSILGLGIAIETSVYKQVMYKDGLGGFDKKLQADIIKIIPQLAFAENAIVYDEKVDDGDSLERQRTRWIYTYFKYFTVNWNLLIIGIRKFNLRVFFFGLTALRPPLFLLFGSTLILLIVNIFLFPLGALVWAIILFLFIISFILIVITQSRQQGMGKALLYIPVIIFRQMRAFFKMKKASRQFLKTENRKIIYIDELLKNEPV